MTYSFLLYNVLVLDIEEEAEGVGTLEKKKASEKIPFGLRKHLPSFQFFCVVVLNASYPAMFSSNEVWLYMSHLFRRSSVVSTASAAAERPKVSS